jgi:CBS domain-containing protein
MQVSDILESKGRRVISIAGSEPVSAAADILSRERIGALLVKLGDEEPAGILSERDIVRGLAEHGHAALDLLASQLMTRDLVTCTPESSTEDIMTQMLEGQFRHLPVVRNGSLVGIISIGDVVKAVLSELKWMTKVLQDQVVAAAGWATDED